MTIAGWFGSIILCILILVGGCMAYTIPESSWGKAICIIITIILIIATISGFLWYFNNTASGQRALIDQQSNLNNGIERVVNVYTADGNILASYEGKIDIEMNDGGYIKFDFEGKRYIYYNCFVETIANIN